MSLMMNSYMFIHASNNNNNNMMAQACFSRFSLHSKTFLSPSSCPLHMNLPTTYLFDIVPKCFSIRSISRRAKKREKIVSFPQTHPVSILVAGNGAPGNGRSVFLKYQDRSYLFNCSEGTQRLVFSNQWKVSKLQYVLTTSHSWENVSGLFGLALACYDSGLKYLRWLGLNNGMRDLLRLCIFFDYKLKKDMTIDCEDAIRKSTINDDLMSIDTIVMADDNNLDKLIAAYICKFQAQSGVFRIDKCFQLNVPRNLADKLEAGEEIVLADGRTIKPEDAYTHDEKEQTVIVLECPTLNHIDSIINHKHLSCYQSSESVAAIIHFTPHFIANDVRYKDWMNNFASTTKHMMINSDNPSYCLYQVHRFQAQLNLLDDSIFPLLKECNKEVKCEKDNIIKPHAGSELILRPYESNGVLKNDLPLQLNLEEIHQDCFEREGFRESYEQLKKDLKSFNESHNVSQYPEILFLGTGSALPGVARNVSGILVNTNANSSILLECGEDTVGQLNRFYGKEEMNSVLSRIKTVFISHTHSDHHFGLVRLIKERFAITRERLLIILPPLLLKWLQIYSKQVEDISMLYHFIMPRDMNPNSRKDFVKALGLKELTTVPVHHCAQSFGVSLVTNDDRKIVFSGDAMPTQALIDIGRCCDVLIHEATVDDSMHIQAKECMHSTVSEAIDMGRKMNAKFTILTHFSQRYSKMPLLPDEIDDNVGIAFDNMRVSLDELPKLSLMLPALRCLYGKHLDVRKYIGMVNERKMSVWSNQI